MGCRQEDFTMADCTNGYSSKARRQSERLPARIIRITMFLLYLTLWFCPKKNTAGWKNGEDVTR